MSTKKADSMDKPKIPPKPVLSEYNRNYEMQLKRDRTKKPVVPPKPESISELKMKQHLKSNIKQSVALCNSNILLNQPSAEKQDGTIDIKANNDNVLCISHESSLTTKDIRPDSSKVDVAQTNDGLRNFCSRRSEGKNLINETHDNVTDDANIKDDTSAKETDRKKKIKKSIGPYPVLPQKPDYLTNKRKLEKLEAGESATPISVLPTVTKLETVNTLHQDLYSSDEGNVKLSGFENITSVNVSEEPSTISIRIVSDQMNMTSSICTVKRQGNVDATCDKVKEHKVTLTPNTEIIDNDSIMNCTGITSIISNDGSLVTETHTNGKEKHMSHEQINKDANQQPATLTPRITVMFDDPKEMSSMSASAKCHNKIKNTSEEETPNAEKGDNDILINTSVTPDLDKYESLFSETHANGTQIGSEEHSQKQINEAATQPPSLPPQTAIMSDETKKTSSKFRSTNRQSEIQETSGKGIENIVNLNLIQENKVNVIQTFDEISGISSIKDSNTDTYDTNKPQMVPSTLQTPNQQTKSNDPGFVETIQYDREQLNRHEDSVSFNSSFENELNAPHAYKHSLDCKQSLDTSCDNFETDGKRQKAFANKDSEYLMMENTRKSRNDREFHVPLFWQTSAKDNCIEKQMEITHGSDSYLAPVTSSDRLGDTRETETLCMAKFDFTPSERYDLELVQGSIYEILDQTHEHWWKLKNKFGATGYIPSNYVSTRSELAMYSWYFKDVTTEECEAILNVVHNDGCFMIRDASTQVMTYMYSLSLFCSIRRRVYHYHIKNTTGRFCLNETRQHIDTIPELVKYHKQYSGGMKTRLTSPPPLTYKVNPHKIVTNAISSRWKIDGDDLEIGAYIGSGSFGRICKGTLGGSAVATEELPSTQLSHTDLSNEFSIMSRLSHPNLLHLYGVVTDTEPMLKVIEFIQYGNLATYLRQHKLGLMNKFDILISMCLQICSGMEYLHSRGYIHGCLAARSCMVGTNRTVKIADLSGAKNVVGVQHVRFSKCFIKWASPEVIRTGSGDKKADVWSFGTLMWEIFTCGNEPFAQMTNKEYKYKVTELEDCLPKPAACPMLFYSIMMACMDKDPSERLTFRELLTCCSMICEEGTDKFAEALKESEQDSLSLSDLGLDPREMHLFMLALKEGEESDNFIRVMVVGNFNQGKTSLTRRLLSLDLDDIDSTDGIDIHSAKCGIDDTIWTKNVIYKYDESGAHRLANVVKLRESTEYEDAIAILKGDTPKTDFTTTSQHTNMDCVSSNDYQEEINLKQTTDQSNTCENTETVSHAPDLLTTLDSSSDSLDASDSESTDTDSSKDPETSVDVPSDKNVSVNIKDINLLAGFSQKLREHKETYSEENDQSIHVNIWDFGGQFVYYATHQIFHSRDAIYLLVFDLRKDLNSIVDDDDFPDRKTVMKESLRFWVSSVHAFVGSEDGREPKIILIGTHKSACKSYTEIEQRFDEVLDLFAKTKARNHIYKKPLAVENTDPNDPSFTEVKNAIYDIGLEKAQSTKVPAKWIQLEIALKGVRQAKILRFEDVVEIDISTDYPIQDEKELKVFLKYHHAKGSLVYFDEKYLCDYVIIDPQFLVDAFKCIITSKRFCKWSPDLHCRWEKLKETAVLEKQLINGVWESDKTNQFLEHRDVLIAFLQRHRIISEILHIDELTGEPEGHGKYIVPSLLKAECDNKMLARVLEGKEPVCSKTVLGISFEDNAILKTVFEKVTAAALGRWPPLEVDGNNLIFLNDAFFRIDLQHAARIAKKGEKGIELMVISQCPPIAVSGVVCDRFRRYLETVILYEFQRLNSARSAKPFVYYLKCNHVDHMGVGSRNSHDSLDDIKKRYRVCCPDNAGHSLIVKEAMSEWFQAEKVTKPEEVPKRKVTEKDLSGVAQAVAGNWELLGTCLGLGTVEIEQIKMDHRFTQTAIYYMLLSWKSHFPTNDTLYDLIKAMNGCDALTVDWDKIKNILDKF